MNYIKLFILLFLLNTLLYSNQNLKKVTLQLSWLDQFQFAGYYIAKEKGFYKEVGLDVSIKPFEFGLDIPNDVSNGKYDFSIGRETLILEKTNNKKIVALYALFQASPLILMSTKESGIASISDFNNKKIMTTIDDAGEVSIKSMITSQKIDVKKLTFVKHTHNINDLIQNNTDVISAYSSKSPYHLQQKGIEYNIFSPKDYGFDMYSDLLYTNESNINNNLETVLKFKEASLRGWEYAYSNIEESVDLIIEKYNTQNLTKDELIFEANVLKELSYYQTETLGNIELNKLQRIYDLYNVMGLVNNKTDIEDFVLIENNFSLFLKKVLNNLSKYINLPYIYFFIILFLILISLLIYKQIRLLKNEKQLLLKNDELLKNKENLNEVLEASGEGIWDWNIKTNQVDHNNTWYKILGLDINKDLIEDFTTLIHPEDKENVLKKIDDTLQSISKNYQSEHRLFKKNGEIVWVIDKGRIVEYDDVGNPLRMAGSFSDITVRKKVEAQLENQHIKLINSEKMVSMGEMIANIAHQWRQPLSVISTAATGMKIQKEYDLLSDKELIESCDAINNNAQYLSKTIDDFKNFIKGDSEKRIFNLSDNINSFLQLAEGSIKNNNINIVLDLQKDIKIDGYENELIQCLINIFNNAKDVLIEKEIKNKLLFITSSVNEDNTIIKIKDNAGGIPKDVISKIFEPYFTTKHQSQGTGLGLHMTYNLIVDGMGGEIEVKNVSYKYDEKEYVGAEFNIYLPIILL